MLNDLKLLTYKPKIFNGCKIYSPNLYISLSTLDNYETYSVEFKLSRLILVVNDTVASLTSEFNITNDRTITAIRNILLENFISSFMFIIHEHDASLNNSAINNSFNASFITLYKDLNIFISEKPHRTSLGKIIHTEYLSKIFPDIDNIKNTMDTLLKHFNLSHKHIIGGYIKERLFNKNNGVMRITVTIVFLI